MSTANKGKIPLAQVAQVVLELAKSKKRLTEVTQELKSEKEKSKSFWLDRKGDEFRVKIQEIIALNTKVGEEMIKQIRALQEYYATSYNTAQQAHFNTGKI